VWERGGEYRRVEEKRGKVRKQMDVPLHPQHCRLLPPTHLLRISLLPGKPFLRSVNSRMPEN
jgi:hypothetical protein